MPKVVPAHNDVRRLIELDHYESHEKRTESAEFRRVKEEFKKEHAQCWVNNKYCEGQLEVHHNIIEYSAITEVDMEKVRAEYPFFTSPENKGGMRVLCAKHHRGKFHGVHSMTYPIWVLQKFMTDEALDNFEKAIQEEIKKEQGQ